MWRCLRAGACWTRAETGPAATRSPTPVTPQARGPQPMPVAAVVSCAITFALAAVCSCQMGGADVPAGMLDLAPCVAALPCTSQRP